MGVNWVKKILWKDIGGYEGAYEVSTVGMIRSKSRTILKGKNFVPSKIKGQIISPYVNSAGYMCVTLYRAGKKRNEKVHSLVAKAFIPNELNKKTVNHIDENKLNNTVENLEWMTNSENVNYGTRIQRVKEKYGVSVTRISPSKKIETFRTLHEAEEKTGIARQSISYAIKNKTLLKGYKWEGDFKIV